MLCCAQVSRTVQEFSDLHLSIPSAAQRQQYTRLCTDQDSEGSQDGEDGKDAPRQVRS